jgi:hypothetical protein
MTKAGTTLAVPAYEDLQVATTLVCRGEPQDGDGETNGEGGCIIARDGGGPLLIPILTANVPAAHEKARILEQHYGMPVRVVSLAGLVRQFPDSPFARMVKDIENEYGLTLDVLNAMPMSKPHD